MNHNCAKCGNWFSDPRRKAKFCSHLCYSSSLIGKKTKWKKVECAFCRASFEAQLHIKSKFCSHSCYAKSLIGKRFKRKPEHKCICKNCGSEWFVYPCRKSSKFCSRKCKSTWSSGERSPTWKGGKTSDYNKFKASREFKLWREAVFSRDGYSCQHCGYKSGSGKTIDIHPHHIFSASKFPDKRTLLSNGITLCAPCHGRVHSINFKHRSKRKPTRRSSESKQIKQ